MVKELFELARRADESLSMPLFRTQQWFFFFVATFYLYGRCAAVTLQNPGSLLHTPQIQVGLHRKHILIYKVFFGLVKSRFPAMCCHK